MSARPQIEFHREAEEMLPDVLDGLRRTPKRISCKYFYDDAGSALFERITELPEYYPTRTELAIMEKFGGEMAARIGPGCCLVEYGSGSSRKTRVLLDALEDPVAYVAVDISADALEDAARRLANRYPDLDIRPVCADYTQPYELPNVMHDADHRVVYFPGSTLGNFTPREAEEFLTHLSMVTGRSGGLLIGIDLVKDRETLERAYDDSQGVTAEFNRNVLERINRELGADFRVDRFAHRAVWDEAHGRIEMHLESLDDQRVRIDGEEILVAKGERILTEYSHKYTVEGFAQIAAGAGFRVRRVWTDEDRLFSVQYLEVASAGESP